MNVAPKAPESGFDVWEDDGPMEQTHVRVADDAWRDSLLMHKSKDGDLKVVPCGANATTILRFHPKWRDVIAYDQFGDCVVKTKTPPWHPVDAPSNLDTGAWADSDTVKAQYWLARNENLQVPVQALEGAVVVAAEANAFHPVRDYLNSLKWDGTPRLFRVLSSYFGTDDSAYTQAVGKRWMISAVARIMKPGCQADCMLVLEGAQGIGKTTSVRALVGADTHESRKGWYSDTGINIGDKDSYQNLRSCWIYGLDELDSLRRSEVTKTKNFISTQVDKYRPSFGRHSKSYPRQNVFIGTTNENEYLPDRTGNRRFLPVRVKRKIDMAAIRRDRDQLWAEAKVCFDAGQPWHMDTEEVRQLCDGAQEERTQRDPWEEMVGHWLTSPKRRETGYPFGDVGEGVLTSDVLEHALGRVGGDVSRGDEMRVSQVLRALGYERGPFKTEGKVRVRRWFPKTSDQPDQPKLSCSLKGE